MNVTWLEVPTGFVHGILRGYRVFYKITQHNPANAEMYTVVPPNKLYKQLTGLKKFTNYTIQVAAFTRIGYGALSPKVLVSTDEDGMENFNILIIISFKFEEFIILTFWSVSVLFLSTMKSFHSGCSYLKHTSSIRNSYWCKLEIERQK